MSRRPNKNLKFHVRRAVVKMVFFVPKAPLRVTQADDAPHVHPHPSARYNAAMCKRKQKEHTFAKKKVLPGIEPGLPEDTDFEIRIRSDNRYLEWLLAGASEKCEVGKRTLQNRYKIEI
jgi:hypothetical protein